MTTESKTTLPSLADDAQYSDAMAKLTSLQTELGRLSARRDVVLGQLNIAASAPPRRADAITAAAYRLLGATDSTPGANAGALREELGALDESLAVHVEATRLQRGIVTGLQVEASRRIIAGVLPRHKELVREIAKRIKDLDAVLAEEHDLREALFERDIHLGELVPMPLSYHGLLRDPHSRASNYLIEACARGFLGLGELPENLRDWAKAKKAPAPPTMMRAVKKVADGWIG